MSRKVLICGDRNWSDEKVIYSWLAKLQDWGYDEVIHGGAKGADSIAGQLASKIRFKVTEVPAQWSRYGRAAGPIRNTEMLKYDPELVVAFHDNLDKSKGTRNMVEQAKRAGIRVYVVNMSGDAIVY